MTLGQKGMLFIVCRLKKINMKFVLIDTNLDPKVIKKPVISPKAFGNTCDSVSFAAEWRG